MKKSDYTSFLFCRNINTNTLEIDVIVSIIYHTRIMGMI